jgi:hypothetical protein
MSIYRTHADTCLSIIMCLKPHLLIPELIQIIIKMYWNLYSTPVCILYTPNNTNLRTRWYASPLGNAVQGHGILDRLRETSPGLRFYDIINENTETPQIVDRDGQIYCKGIRPYHHWSPMIILVPGPLWDRVMLDPDANTKLVDGVQIFNGGWEGNILWYFRKYDLQNDDSFVQWLKVSLSNNDFLAVQNVSL